jgi:hypothetical protein
MPDQQTPDRDTRIIHLEPSDLVEHFPENPGDRIGIVMYAGKLFPQAIFQVFYVREVDIDQAPDLPECIHGIIAVGVVDNGDNQSPSLGFRDGISHLEDHVGW